MEPIVSVTNLQKHFKIRQNRNLVSGLFNPDYRSVKAVDGISFSINKGEAVAFLGPNGAGKTTTTKMLVGLMYPTGGEIQVLGYTPFERNPEFLMHIGLVMGNKSGLNWDLTANQSLWLLKHIYKISDADYNARLRELTKLLQVEDLLDTQVRRLSLGERMKLELIGAILHRPDVLFLDEPTIGLDILTKKNIRQFLRKIQQETGVTLILTSHDMDDIEQVCDRVIVINKGSKVYDDSLETLTGQYRQNRYVRLFFQEAPAAELLSRAEILEQHDGEYLVRVAGDQLVPLLASVADSNLIDIHIESVPLEAMIADIFKQG